MSAPRPAVNEWAPDVVSRPGETLLDLLNERGLTQSWLSHQLGVARSSVCSIVSSGRNRISPDLAIRLEALGLGNARFWLHRQADYDLWLARKAMHCKKGSRS